MSLAALLGAIQVGAVAQEDRAIEKWGTVAQADRAVVE